MPIAQSSSKNQSENKLSKKNTKVSECEPEQKQEQTQASNTGSRTPPEQPEFIKQTLLIIEKKVRNLDKRRQKLEEYRESQRKGTVLNEDQLSAVSKYDEVLRTLELTRELEKQFVSLANDTMKQQKKQAKRDQMEREEQLKEKLKELHRYFAILSRFGDETVRNDFLNETNGAVKITQKELEFLDELDKLVTPCTPGDKLDLASCEFADHLSALIDGKNKPITVFKESITYSEMKKLFERLLSASYWTVQDCPVCPDKQEVTTLETETETETTPVETESEAKPTESLNEAVENMQLNEQKNTLQNEQGLYQNQHVDDFVIVSSSECAESLCHSKSASVEPQSQSEVSQELAQSQSKTFFTTLNQPEQRQDINEFINSCENNGEGLNFFQDSELTPRQQEQLQQQQQNEMNFQRTQHQENYNQQSNEMQKDQGFKQRGPRENGNRPYQQRRNQDDRRNGNHMQQQRNNDNRGPRNNNGYRGGAPGNGPRGGHRGNGRPNNNQRGNYQQARGNFNQDMHHEQHSQMA